MTTECRFQHLGADSLGILSEKKHPTEIDQGGPLKGKPKNEGGRLPGISDDIFWIHIFGLDRKVVQLEPKRDFFLGANPQKVWVNLGGQIKRCHTLEESEKDWVKECDLS